MSQKKNDRKVTATEFASITRNLRTKTKAFENNEGRLDAKKVELGHALAWLAANATAVETLVQVAKDAKAAATEGGHGRAYGSALAIVTAGGKSKVNADKLIKAAVASMKTVRNIADLQGLITPFIKTK